jgi:hypothetical protein
MPRCGAAFSARQCDGRRESEAQEFFAPRKIEVIDDIDEQEHRL